MTSNSLAIPQGQLLRVNKAPEALNAIINLEAWASAVVRRTPYTEPDPEFISRMLAYQTITAETAEEVFRQANILGLQGWLTDSPGATTGPLEITDLYVASSDFETGNPSYVIITAIDLQLGHEVKFTTGATNIQATLIGLLANGMWPIRCQVKRGDSKDKGGRYLMFLLPPD
jgi:hypothetical protein